MRWMYLLILFCSIVVNSALADNYTDFDWKEGAGAEIITHQDYIEFTLERYDGTNERWPKIYSIIRDLDTSKYNGIKLTLRNPLDTQQSIALDFKDTKGLSEAKVFTIEPGKSTHVKVSFDELEQYLDISGISQITLYRSRPSRNHRYYLSNVRFYVDKTEKTYFEFLKELMHQAQNAMQDVDIREVQDQRSLKRLAERLDYWRDILVNDKSIRAKGTECERDLNKIIVFAKRERLLQENPSGMVIWKSPCESRLITDKALAQYENPARKIEIYCADNEYEEICLRITNLQNQAEEIIPEFLSDSKSIIKTISLKRAVNVLARDATVAADAITPLGPAGYITVPAEGTVELRLRVDTKNHKVPSDSYNLKLNIHRIRKPDSSINLPITINKLNVDLPAYTGFDVLAWDEMFTGRSQHVLAGQEQQAVNNLADYGVNCYVIMASDIPWPVADDNGNLTEPLDFELLDKRIKFYKSAQPNPVFLFITNFNNPDDKHYWLKSELKPGSTEWENAISQWLVQWTQHLHKLGISWKNCALYLNDEPSQAGLDVIRQFGPVARKAVPQIRIYTNSSHLYGNKQKDRQLIKQIDIWQPELYSGIENNPELKNVLVANEDIIKWIYACEMSMRSSKRNIYDYYRLMAWKAVELGFSGCGFWSYSASHNEYPWDGTSGRAAGGIVIYPGKDRLLMSRRWEAMREGLEDARFYYLLEKALKKTADSNLRNEINNLLTSEFKAVVNDPKNTSLAQNWQQKTKMLLDKTK